MNKQKIYTSIATGFGLNKISAHPKISASVTAFLLAMLIKQSDSAEIILMGCIIIIGLIGFRAIKLISRNNPNGKQTIVIDDIVGTWIAMFFFSNSFLLNIFAFVNYQIINRLRNIFMKQPQTLSLSNSLYRQIGTGILSNGIVYSILLLVFYLK